MIRFICAHPAIIYEERLINILAHEMNVSRSRLFAMAMEDYIRWQNQQMFQKINRTREDMPDNDEEKLLANMRICHRRIVEGEC